MKRPQILISTIAAASLLICSAASAEWRLPQLNPFSKPAAASRPEEKSGLLKMPGWNVFRGRQTRRTGPQAPSTWDKMSRGTKQFLGKTKDVLTPWDDSSHTASHRGEGKSQGGGTSAFFTGWFRDDKPPQQPRTVSEFLSQPRP